MKTELRSGVHLEIFPTQKYKTTTVMIRFSTPADEKKMTKRSLLASLLETNSLNYPTQTKIGEKLADLYGASFGINVQKKGRLHCVTVAMTLVNETVLPTKETLLKEAIDFLKEILFAPNIKNGAFDQATFDREKANLKDEILSVMDDKQALASLRLQALYFEDEAQKAPSFGTLKALEQETAASIAEYYQEMIAEDQIDLFVLGDVDTQTVTNLMSELPFKERKSLEHSLFYTQSFSNVTKEKVEQYDVIQAKLNLGYYVEPSKDDETKEVDYFAFQVFNGLFGGFPHSKLFMNVREKESMAYYVSSHYNLLRSFLMVQTGIESKNRDRVFTMIGEQLESLRLGQISAEELAQTKSMLKNQYRSSLDLVQTLLEQAYFKRHVPELTFTEAEWLEKVEAITVEDVQKVAARVRLQAVYFMEGRAE